ncbi:unnamed protein product [Penicillium bialowiezense]
MCDLVTLVVAFPKWDNKKGGSDGKSGDDDDHQDGRQPWDGDNQGSHNRTICISIPDGGSWFAISPAGDKHAFDDLKWDSGSGSSDGGY